jgi:hypothetical protein
VAGLCDQTLTAADVLLGIVLEVLGADTCCGVVTRAGPFFATTPDWYWPACVSSHVCGAGAMRSHLHFDESKDLWVVELKVPRQMAPVTLGFVLWNAGGGCCTLGGFRGLGGGGEEAGG